MELPEEQLKYMEGDHYEKRFKFDNYEIRILILAINELRNQLIREERYTDAVDELILKIASQCSEYIQLTGFRDHFIMMLLIVIERLLWNIN